ncbi:peptidase S8/S53 domain-containing protein [Gamsiella multidivaricata]|uniref:peptidase S8/S53 domain-containing protein n=1 Tax=Gamsiella multidivaricata TaxID=101098 RepID=UPI00221E6497|nr:peptidase S8/S53 domain-containing protein [Gamsiella multidivaricata]KAG0359070.1 serine protease [Gamsiella multidivaricata]KAI7826912.1 peptidase S8/S53 domain-containing protein [Gamsiella multidivaricata]
MLLKLSAVVLFMASSAVAFPSFSHSEKLAPIISSADADIIPDSYFVVFKTGVRANDHSAWVHDLHKRDVSMNGIWDNITSGVKHVYDMGPFQGIAGRFRPDVLEEIRKNPDVDYIERDQIVYTSEITTQSRAPWGLARISHRKGLTLGTFNKYEHNPRGGEGVRVFVIDTGINTEHKEFEGRADWGATIPQGDPDSDDNGHGTHCAGTIGSSAYGVSKKARVVAIKVLRSNGSGTMSDVVAGVDFAVQAHLALKSKQGRKYKGSVANMSLGGGKSRPLDTAVANAVDSGLHFAVAAGNDNRDACDYSPAAVETAVTVGASTIDDKRAYFSNHGPCVDIFGPGLDILSTWIGSDTARRTISGTSMASPHVAGLIAYYLSLAPESSSSFHTGPLTPKEMKALLIARGTRDVLSDVKSDTPNILIYNNASEDKESFYAW